jgi:hypothetical protein
MPILLDLHENKLIRDEEFKIYDVEVNSQTTYFDNMRSVVEFDSDGDVRVHLKVSDEDILSNIKVESIISYMEDLGYKVI